MKKILSILIIASVSLFAQTVWNGKIDTVWYNVSQTEFTITTAEQLAGLAKLVNNKNDFKNKFIKLGANIMLNDTTNWRNWATQPPANEWTSMGESSLTAFEGTFDGNSFVIGGVYINNSKENQGLFGDIGRGGLIKRLGVAASYIKGGYHNVGGLVGFSGGGTISESYFFGIVTGNKGVGGLVGYNRWDGVIKNSYSAGVVTGSMYVGGLAGGSEDNGSLISDSYSFSEVTGDSLVGGLVGLNGRCKINNSHSTGAVKGIGNEIGGLVGNNEGSIDNSYSTGAVTTKGNDVGGLVGSNRGLINYSYSTGVVTTKGNNVGGLVGEFGGNDKLIRNSYSTGSVTGIGNVGGLVGHNDANYVSGSYSTGKVNGVKEVGGFVGKISYQRQGVGNYYDKQSSGRSNGIGRDDTKANRERMRLNGMRVGNSTELMKLEGKTTAQMKQKATFVDWDFDEIWDINSKINKGYPYLINNKGN